MQDLHHHQGVGGSGTVVSWYLLRDRKIADEENGILLTYKITIFKLDKFTSSRPQIEIGIHRGWINLSGFHRLEYREVVFFFSSSSNSELERDQGYSSSGKNEKEYPESLLLSHFLHDFSFPKVTPWHYDLRLIAAPERDRDDTRFYDSMLYSCWLVNRNPSILWGMTWNLAISWTIREFLWWWRLPSPHECHLSSSTSCQLLFCSLGNQKASAVTHHQHHNDVSSSFREVSWVKSEKSLQRSKINFLTEKISAVSARIMKSQDAGIKRHEIE